MKKHENGQSLVIIALMFLGLVAIAALVVDGGSLYLNRRSAQTAADAAAMAGTRTLCIDKGSYSDVQAAVTKYALNENGATAVDLLTVDTTPNGTTGAIYSVSVRATISTPSFLARVLGFQNNTATAEASAGCFTPSATKNLLPIAWSCAPKPGDPTDKCSVHSIPWSIFDPTLSNAVRSNSSLILDEDVANTSTAAAYMDGSGGKMIYIVMDKEDFDSAIYCAPTIGTGTMNCDFNNDGISDLKSGADRGWLMLDGTGTHDLVAMMNGGFTSSVKLPQWFPGKTGAVNRGFSQVPVNQIVFIPMFNAICPSSLPTQVETNCPSAWEDGDIVKDGNGSSLYYRVTSFAPFFITCVTSQPSDRCPGKSAVTGIANNISTVEGYFIDGYVGGSEIHPYGYNFGAYIVSLMK